MILCHCCNYHYTSEQSYSKNTFMVPFHYMSSLSICLLAMHYYKKHCIQLEDIDTPQYQAILVIWIRVRNISEGVPKKSIL